MKKFKSAYWMLIIMIVWLVFLSGCSYIQTNPTAEVGAKIVARRLAVHAAEVYPEFKDEMGEMCKAFLAVTEPGGSQKAMEVGYSILTYLNTKFPGNELLIADLKELMSLVEFRGDPTIDWGLMRPIVVGLKDGLKFNK